MTTTSLAILSRVPSMLAEATTIQKAKELKDLALTASDFAKRKKMGAEVVAEADRYALLAERRLGELLKATADTGERATLGRPQKRSTGVTFLEDLGISKNESSKAQQVASLDESTFSAVVEGKKTRKAAIKEQRKAAKEKERAAKARAASKATAGKDYGVKHCDFRDAAIEDNSIDLVFTDPPYHRKTIGLYGDLASWGARVLKPGGSLLCYSGQTTLLDVLDLMRPHLRLWWVCACYHTGKTLLRLNEYGIVNQWKPILWFVKDTRRDKHTFVNDLVVSQPEKTEHKWQQGIIDAAYYVELLSEPGDLVADPFCGGGTTAAACKKLQRNWWTCDIDGESVAIARKRLQDLDS